MKDYLIFLIVIYFSAVTFVKAQVNTDDSGYSYRYENNIQEKISVQIPESVSAKPENVMQTIQVVSNSLMDFLWVAGDSGDYYWSGLVRSNSYSFQLPSGTYHLFTRLPDTPPYGHRMDFFYIDFVLHNDTTINVDFSKCSNIKHLRLKREDNTELINSQRSFIIKHDSVHLAFILQQIPIITGDFLPELTIYYNNIPFTPMSFQWAVTGNNLTNNGKFYYLGDKVFPNRDTLITNDTENFQHNIINYYFSEIDNRNAVQSSILWSGYYSYIIYTSGLYFPVKMDIYNNSNITPDLYFSKRAFFVNYGLNGDGQMCLGNLYTLPLFFKDGKVYGYLRYSKNNRFILASRQDITLGLTPTFWYGKFVNSENQIAINTSWGTEDDDPHYSQIFLSQTNDALAHFPIEMEIKNSSDSVVVNKELSPGYIMNSYDVLHGYPIADLQQSVSPGIYTATFVNNKDYLMDTLQCTVTAINKFDTRLTDKNPPNIETFQIMGDSSITHQLFSNKSNIVRFWAEDSSGIVMAHLYYREYNTTFWHAVSLHRAGNFYYGYLPELNTGNYSLKTYLADMNGNSLTMLQEPAFVYQHVVGIGNDDNSIPDKFMLAQNYPNPFNPSTIIKYSIPSVIARRSGATTRQSPELSVQLNVYDILGRKVATLVNKKQAPGNYTVQFDASKLSSGIYFYTLRAGEFTATKKMILMK